MRMSVSRNLLITLLSSAFLWLLPAACSEKSPDPEPQPEALKLKAADLSFLPEIEDAGIVFYNLTGQEEDMLTTLKNAGMNTVRIRLWHTPAGGRSGYGEVKAFAEKVRNKGLKVWLTVYYSDTWADPGHQQTPEAWQNLDLAALTDSVYRYTAGIINGIKPDYIQIGNEINAGMLWPTGKYTNLVNLKALLASGVKAVRDHDKNCKIMLHIAGPDQAEWLFSNLQSIDYDITAVSYYPFWHGKDLTTLGPALKNLNTRFLKPVVIAETAYPFTLGWNDWTNNIIGSNDQIHPDYPASEAGQLAFMKEISRISFSANGLAGFCYWGAEWVAFKGPQASNGSSWENMALYDFSNKALPAIEAFGTDQ